MERKRARISPPKSSRQFAPDAVGLQEALRHQLDDLGERLPGYAEIGVGRDDGKTKGEYSPILYRADRFEPLESGTFWLSDTPEVIASKSWGNDIPRVCTWARLKEKSSGRAFYLFNVHFDHQSQPSREKSAALVVGRMKARAHPGEPAFLTGDFNAGEDNPAIAAIKKAGYADSFREVHPDEKAVGTFNGWGGAGATAGAKIDYIFAPAGTKVADAQIDRVAKDGRTPSDHFPVTAVVEWKR
ncbi:MAG: endonuclease/exonuclease/phosphatase family protein [Verrucomicrobiales bacterium]